MFVCEMVHTGFRDASAQTLHELNFFCFVFLVPVPLEHVSHAFSPLLAEPVHSLHFTVVIGHVGTQTSDVHQWRIWVTEFGHNLQTQQRKIHFKQKTKLCIFEFTSEKIQMLQQEIIYADDC